MRIHVDQRTSFPAQTEKVLSAVAWRVCINFSYPHMKCEILFSPSSESELVLGLL